MKILNNYKYKLKRRSLRNNATEVEKILWSKLKGKRLAGYKFVRQYSVSYYIVDFYRSAERIAIELDGSHHQEKDIADYDSIRTIHLESYNIKVLRFQNNEIKSNLNSVLSTIYYFLEYHSPNPLSRGK